MEEPRSGPTSGGGALGFPGPSGLGLLYYRSPLQRIRVATKLQWAGPEALDKGWLENLASSLIGPWSLSNAALRAGSLELSLEFLMSTADGQRAGLPVPLPAWAQLGGATAAARSSQSATAPPGSIINTDDSLDVAFNLSHELGDVKGFARRQSALENQPGTRTVGHMQQAPAPLCQCFCQQAAGTSNQGSKGGCSSPGCLFAWISRAGRLQAPVGTQVLFQKDAEVHLLELTGTTTIPASSASPTSTDGQQQQQAPAAQGPASASGQGEDQVYLFSDRQLDANDPLPGLMNLSSQPQLISVSPRCVASDGKQPLTLKVKGLNIRGGTMMVHQAGRYLSCSRVNTATNARPIGRGSRLNWGRHAAGGGANGQSSTAIGTGSNPDGEEPYTEIQVDNPPLSGLLTIECRQGLLLSNAVHVLVLPGTSPLARELVLGLASKATPVNANGPHGKGSSGQVHGHPPAAAARKVTGPASQPSRLGAGAGLASTAAGAAGAAGLPGAHTQPLPVRLLDDEEEEQCCGDDGFSSHSGPLLSGRINLAAVAEAEAAASAEEAGMCSDSEALNMTCPPAGRRSMSKGHGPAGATTTAGAAAACSAPGTVTTTASPADAAGAGRGAALGRPSRNSLSQVPLGKQAVKSEADEARDAAAYDLGCWLQFWAACRNAQPKQSQGQVGTPGRTSISSAGVPSPLASFSGNPTAVLAAAASRNNIQEVDEFLREGPKDPDVSAALSSVLACQATQAANMRMLGTSLLGLAVSMGWIATARWVLQGLLELFSETPVRPGAGAASVAAAVAGAAAAGGASTAGGSLLARGASQMAAARAATAALWASYPRILEQLTAQGPGLSLLHRAAASGSAAMVGDVAAWAEAAGLGLNWAEPAAAYSMTPLHLVASSKDNGLLAIHVLRRWPETCELWLSCTAGVGPTALTPADIAAGNGQDFLNRMASMAALLVCQSCDDMGGTCAKPPGAGAAAGAGVAGGAALRPASGLLSSGSLSGSQPMSSASNMSGPHVQSHGSAGGGQPLAAQLAARGSTRRASMESVDRQSFHAGMSHFVAETLTPSMPRSGSSAGQPPAAGSVAAHQPSPVCSNPLSGPAGAVAPVRPSHTQVDASAQGTTVVSYASARAAAAGPSRLQVEGGATAEADAAQTGTDSHAGYDSHGASSRLEEGQDVGGSGQALPVPVADVRKSKGVWGWLGCKS